MCTLSEIKKNKSTEAPPCGSSSSTTHTTKPWAWLFASLWSQTMMCSDPTSNGQVSVLQCHPWIGNTDTHNTRMIYNRVQSHTYYIECLKRELITIIWVCRCLGFGFFLTRWFSLKVLGGWVALKWQVSVSLRAANQVVVVGGSYL